MESSPIHMAKTAGKCAHSEEQSHAYSTAEISEHSVEDRHAIPTIFQRGCMAVVGINS